MNDRIRLGWAVAHALAAANREIRSVSNRHTMGLDARRARVSTVPMNETPPATLTVESSFTSDHETANAYRARRAAATLSRRPVRTMFPLACILLARSIQYTIRNER